jgi:hypothetical protein
MDKPTQEEQRELWEHFGFKWHYIEINPEPGVKYRGAHWVYPDGARYFAEIPLTLDNLFRWAVPKLPYVVLENCQAGYIATVSADMCHQEKLVNKDPALALFRAIQQVIKEG